MKTVNALEKAQYLFVTLGTAFAYHHNEIRDYVCNCHKIPNSSFSKQLLDLEEMHNSLIRTFELLKILNKDLHIILTISPVKHLRDGITENLRSKARLVELCHKLVEHHDFVQYYPVFEMVQECLRDYRYYEADLAHPNKLAQELVFKHFTHSFLNEQAKKDMLATQQLLLRISHKSLYPDSLSHQQFLKESYRMLQEHKIAMPMQNWDQELKSIMLNLK